MLRFLALASVCEEAISFEAASSFVVVVVVVGGGRGQRGVEGRSLLEPRVDGSGCGEAPEEAIGRGDWKDANPEKEETGRRRPKSNSDFFNLE